MFRKQFTPISDLLRDFVRSEGLETPLMQRRAVAAWDDVAGPIAARYTAEKFIRNQVLHVKITNPALRQDLSMMRQQLVRRINEAAGGQVVDDVRIY